MVIAGLVNMLAHVNSNVYSVPGALLLIVCVVSTGRGILPLVGLVSVMVHRRKTPLGCEGRVQERSSAR